MKERNMQSRFHMKRLVSLFGAALLLGVCGDGALGENAREGISSMEFDGKYGYIDARGDWVVPPRFDEAGNFSANGRALVEENGKYGYIDAKGDWAISPRFDEAGDFSANGLAVAGEPLAKEREPRSFYERTLCNLLIYKEHSTWIPGCARGSEENGKYGYIDAKGDWAIPPRFDEAGGFSANGLAVAEENGKWGYIDAKGDWAISPRFDDAWEFSANGFTMVVENGKYGYIDGKGDWIVPPRFDDAWDFSANGLAKVKENGKYGYIDAKGDWAIPPRFEGAGDFSANGLAEVRENGKDLWIDEAGNTVLSVDSVCGTKVLKKASGKVIWPKETETRICGK
jgi:hypothetical protein